MSQESAQWLNTNTLVGNVAKRGRAWHYDPEHQGEESNHYDGPIPVEDVRRRLLNWSPLEGDITVTATIPEVPEQMDETGVTPAVPASTLTVPDPNRKAIVRSDTGAVLGVFSRSYQVHGYDQWLIKNVATILDADLEIGSAVLLKGGAVCGIQMELPESVQVAGDSLRPFIAAATSLDGSLATTYVTGATRIVCDNTLSYGLQSAATRVKIRHSSKSLSRIGDVRQALEIVPQMAEDFAEEIRTLTSQKVTAAQFNRWVDAYAGLANGRKKIDLTDKARGFAEWRRDGLVGLWKDDARVTPWKGTAWGVLQTANTFEHHVTWAADPAARAIRNTDRMLRGKVDEIDNRALELLAAVA